MSAFLSTKPRATGDELAQEYKQTLPIAFKEQFPNLSEVYESLSVAMHSALSDEKVFVGCLEQIIEHFDARRLFKLGNKQATPVNPEAKSA